MKTSFLRFLVGWCALVSAHAGTITLDFESRAMRLAIGTPFILSTGQRFRFLGHREQHNP
jgi:hypothetical protein